MLKLRRGSVAQRRRTVRWPSQRRRRNSNMSSLSRLASFAPWRNMITSGLHCVISLMDDSSTWNIPWYVPVAGTPGFGSREGQMKDMGDRVCLGLSR